MRHEASLIATLEGLGRSAFHIARELSQNSRSGLTVRFLSKKLELPEEEIEYLVDVNHALIFADLTKVKLVSEGYGAVKRITDGLENHGDVPSLFRHVKALAPHDFRRFEEQISIEKPGGRKAAAEALLEQVYRHPDSVVEYVATQGFSPEAAEVFDLIWQAKSGVAPVSQLRAAHTGSEYEVERAMWELFRGFAVFEMFRFDAEDRLVRVAGLLSEIRQWRDGRTGRKGKPRTLKPARGTPESVETRGLDLSDRICRLVAAIAARPARLRGDGDLFREDRRRLEEVCTEESEPSLSTCLWVGKGAGWLAQVDNELRAADLRDLLETDRVGRQRVLFDWLMTTGSEGEARRVIAALFEDLKPGAWYSVMEFIEFAALRMAQDDQPILRQAGAHWQYVSAGIATNLERILARALEETLFWVGAIDRGQRNGDTVFRVTEVGDHVLTDRDGAKVAKQFPPRDAKIVVQPNFDIVVPLQDVDPLLAVPLEQFTERVSSGQATVYRLDKETFTRAIQEGHDGEAFVSFLLKHNREKSLPDNVLTTLEDWRGSVKRVRLRTVHVLESDDPLVVAEILHRRRFSKYIETVDPQKTVTYANISKAALAKDLEKEGFVVI